jgi:alpha-amylase/alpha-mannosidase (GH57 family)
MSTQQKLNLAFLWHQHQPYYKTKDADGNSVYHLPWVRLHAVKDYYDIPRLLDDFPKLKQNFNLVPSLLVQIEDYVQHRAVDHVWLLTLKRPADLTKTEKEKILNQFFLANLKRMIMPYPRYHELWRKKKSGDIFSDQDILDLQVWYNLCWVGESWKHQDPFRPLFEKGNNFSEADKEQVIHGHSRIMSEVIPLYRRLAEERRIELSVTPFYHPILPLLCDSAVGGNKELHFEHPEDAQKQVDTAISYFEKLFGFRPRGMWPSEGSVSEASVALIGEAGIQWIATDQEILEHSEATQKNICLPYRAGEKVFMIFRNHALSDAIGFTYAEMRVETAVDDFLGRIENIRGSLIKESLNPESCLLNVILDGENCWEFYEENGQKFLKCLYEKLSRSDTVMTTTVGDFLEKSKPDPHPVITRLHAGSWINHNFDIWIHRHKEKDLAWDYLKRTRGFLADAARSKNPDPVVLESAWEEIYIAEGSDWFWWFGDDHHAQNKIEFDSLFRYHLVRVYDLLNEPPPAYLLTPIMAVQVSDKLFRPPSAWIQPRIDGRVSHFYEWCDAGVYDARADGDTMHMADPWMDKIFYGFDLDYVYFRIDFCDRMIEPFKSDAVLQFEIQGEKKTLLQFSANELGKRQSPSLPYRFEFDEIFELAIPRADLHIQDKSKLEVVVSIHRAAREIIRRPSRQPLTIDISDESFDKYLWSV